MWEALYFTAPRVPRYYLCGLVVLNARVYRLGNSKCNHLFPIWEFHPIDAGFGHVLQVR